MGRLAAHMQKTATEAEGPRTRLGKISEMMAQGGLHLLAIQYITATRKSRSPFLFYSSELTELRQGQLRIQKIRGNGQGRAKCVASLFFI
jgi:hypothetical protein